MITVGNLTYTYPRMDTPAVRGLNFVINPGEIFGFLGPSGAGKSTTQKVLTGLLEGYQGQIEVLGRDLSAWGAEIYEQIGVSFEYPNHFLKLTGFENLRYFRRLYRHHGPPPEELLRFVGLEADGDLLVSQYSKGMQTRLGIARALQNDPDLLFLDEPTTGLDPVNARRVKELILAQKAAGKTIFLTTHNMTVAAELCDRVAFLVEGEIILVEAPKVLMLRYGKPQVRVEYAENGTSVHQNFALADLGQNPAFFHLLSTQAVQTIHTQEATLEEIFIQVTGRSLLT